MEIVWLIVGFLLFGIGIWLFKLDLGGVERHESQGYESVVQRYFLGDKEDSIKRVHSTTLLDGISYFLSFVGFFMILYFGLMILTGNASFQ